jgi:hypothetical protein
MNALVTYEPGGRSTQTRPTAADVCLPVVSWRGQKDIVARFWQRVNKTDGCWLWTGASLSGGRYGQIGLGHPSTPGSKRWRTHRFSWELHFGPIPADKVVCHSCDTPLCVRPDHLFLDTQRGNVLDSSHKGRRNAFGRQVLSPDDVRVIRAQFARGISQRDIAQAFSVSKGCIHAVVRGKSWAHLPADPNASAGARQAS